MKIRDKLGIVMGGLSCVILTMFVATWWVSGQQKDDGLVINLAGRQRMLTQKMTKEFLSYELERAKSGRDLPELADRVRNTMKVFDMTLSALKDSGRVPVSLETDNGEYREVPKAKEAMYGKLDAVSKAWKEFSARMEAVLRDGNTAEENLPWIMKSNVLLLKEMDAVVGMMQAQSEKRAGKLLVMGLIGVLLGVCATVIAIMMIQSVIKRLHAIQDFSKQLGTGDLTATSGLGGKDELGMIGNTLDEMAGNLRALFLSINDDADNLNDASSKLANIAREMSAGVEGVSGRANTVATAAEEMSSNMDSVAVATEEASTNVTIVATSAEEMTATINEIAQNSEKARTITNEAVSEAKSASDRVDELGKAAKEIGQVTETITEISEQTNLLALNATIEAARAGEAGKGFAVVANEIKELAKQTAEATGEIKSRIEGIQGSTEGTVTQIEQISKVINEVNEIVSTIAAAVEEQSATTKEIAKNVVQASQGIKDVTENVAQSSSVAGEIARDIADVNRSAGEISENSLQVNASAEELLHLAEQLRDMVSKLKT